MEIIKVKEKKDLEKDIKEQVTLDELLDDSYTCGKCGKRYEVCACDEE